MLRLVLLLLLVCIGQAPAQMDPQPIEWYGAKFGTDAAGVREAFKQMRRSLKAYDTTLKAYDTTLKAYDTTHADRTTFHLPDGELEEIVHDYGPARAKEAGGWKAELKLLIAVFGEPYHSETGIRYQWRNGPESAALRVEKNGFTVIYTATAQRAARRKREAEANVGDITHQKQQLPRQSSPRPSGGFYRLGRKLAPGWEKHIVTVRSNDSNDGDSFHVTGGGKGEWIVRLYHVDAPETEASTRMIERIQDQITAFGVRDKPALFALGKKATAYTTKLVRGQKLVIYTKWTEALGSSKQTRYYAYVQLPNGMLLSEALVHQGFVRIHGSPQSLPDGSKKTAAWREYLEARKPLLRKNR